MPKSSQTFRLPGVLFTAAHFLGNAGLALVALAAAAGFLDRRLDVLSHFAPIYLGLAVLSLVTAIVLPPGARLLSTLLSIVTMLACAWLMLPEYLSHATQRLGVNAPDQLKLIQFNAFGEPGQDRSAAIAWMLAQNADAIVLEESGRLEETLSGKGHYYIDYGNMGAIILTRSKPVETNAIDWSKMWRVPPAQRPPVQLLSYATMIDGHGKYTIFGVHRPWPMNFKAVAEQSAALKRALAEHGAGTAIISGDFNSTPWSYERRREDKGLGIERRTRALFSWPAARVSHNRWTIPIPLLPIDHVYAGPGWATVKVERGPNLGSDHYPVVVTLARVSSGADRKP